MKKKNDDIIKKLKKSFRFKLLIILGSLLAFNTFAWFVYSSTINTQITAGVKSWKIAFEAEQEVVQHIQFDIEELYPGMPNYNNQIKIMNYGESQAEVKYELESVRILGDTFTNENYTSEQLLYILNDNPFGVVFTLSKTVLEPRTDFTNFTILVHWPYDNNNDEADTQWGHKSYNYKLTNPIEKQIVISLILTATQINP